MHALETNLLTKTFGAVSAVTDVSLTIAEGEIFGIIGPDGAGKSTMMRLLAGILSPTSGTAQVLGKTITGDTDTGKKDIGYMPQRFGLYEELTVLENIHFFAEMYLVPQQERDARVTQLLSFTNLAPFVHRRAGRLSGGMKQKLGLACALVHTPKLLLLDEPTNGVDPMSRRDFWRLLSQLLRERITIVFSTSYLDEAERCRRVACMHKGAILACDTPALLKERYHAETLEAAYLALMSAHAHHT